MGDNRFNLRRFVVVIVYFMLLLSFSGPSSRTLEQVASLPVPSVPPCGGLRRAAPNGTMARCVGHIICVSSLGIACVSCVW